MCGIVGVYTLNGVEKNTIDEMKTACMLLKHRGPDNARLWYDNRVVLTHNKLSILELSQLSNQPIVRGKTVVSFNGEIYNYKELIAKYNLGGCHFDGDAIAELYNHKGKST